MQTDAGIIDILKYSGVVKPELLKEATETS